MNEELMKILLRIESDVSSVKAKIETLPSTEKKADEAEKIARQAYQMATQQQIAINKLSEDFDNDRNNHKVTLRWMWGIIISVATSLSIAILSIIF
jgi:hypothetical protein